MFIPLMLKHLGLVVVTDVRVLVLVSLVVHVQHDQSHHCHVQSIVELVERLLPEPLADY